MDASSSLVDAGTALKSFSLTHIVYDSTSPIGLPLALVSVSPIFLFVAYFSLVVFTRRLSLALLAAGSVFNEALSLGLKRLLKSPRPFPELKDVGHGYGMPSSHTQAAAFLLAWGIGYATSDWRYATTTRIGRVRKVVYLVVLAAWSFTVAYSRCELKYHSAFQVGAGYVVGVIAGTAWYYMTEHVPHAYPHSFPGKVRSVIESIWTGIGGIGGWQLGGAEGGWGEGWLTGVEQRGRKSQ